MLKKVSTCLKNLHTAVVWYPFQQTETQIPEGQDAIRIITIGYPLKLKAYYEFEYGMGSLYNLIVSIACLMLAIKIIQEDKLSATCNWLFLAAILHFINFITKLLIFLYVLHIPTNLTFIVMKRLNEMRNLRIIHFNEIYAQVLFHFYIFGITGWVYSPICLRNLHWANQVFMVIVCCYIVRLCNQLLAYGVITFIYFKKRSEILAMNGATLDQIDTITLATLTNANIDKLFSSDNSRGCTICSSDMMIEQEVRVLSCKHIYHKKCIDSWLKKNPICPYCKASVVNVLELHYN